MDWIKVKNVHIDAYRHWKPEAFKAWIEIMGLCARIEKIPTEEQMEYQVGKEVFGLLKLSLSLSETRTAEILKKVMEDIERVKCHRAAVRVKSSFKGKKLEISRNIHETCAKTDKQEEEGERDIKKLLPKQKISDEDFIQKLRESPAYSHIDVDKELAKMDLWLIKHPDRKKTSKFVFNWLNKIEAPITAKPVAGRGRAI